MNRISSEILRNLKNSNQTQESHAHKMEDVIRLYISRDCIMLLNFSSFFNTLSVLYIFFFCFFVSTLFLYFIFTISWAILMKLILLKTESLYNAIPGIWLA